MDNSTADNVPQILSSRLRSPRPGEISHFDLARPEIGHSHGDAAAETAAALMPAGGLARNQIPPLWVNLAAAALTWASTMAFYPPVWVGGSRYDVSVISILCDTSPPDDQKKFLGRGRSLRSRSVSATHSLRSFASHPRPASLALAETLYEIPHLKRTCQELCIPIPCTDAAAETVAALMPVGGPACYQIAALGGLPRTEPGQQRSSPPLSWSLQRRGRGLSRRHRLGSSHHIPLAHHMRLTSTSATMETNP